MGEIIVNHRNGDTSRIQTKGSYSQITRAELSKQLLGEDILTITTKSAEPIAFEIGDYVDIFGSIYTINQLPTIERTGTRVFEQTIVLEGTQYELLDVQFILPGNTMYDNLTGDLNDFVDVLLYNANRIYPGKWTKGAVPENTEVKTLSFSEKNCLATLQTLCEEYKAEFEIIISEQGTRTLHLKQIGLEYPFTFTYGRTGGLYQLTRKNINNKNLVTRLYVYGGRNNLGNKYRNSRLCLPDKAKNDSYIEDAAAVDMYGVKENTKVFDEIYPARYGKVTELGEENFAFIDSTMDFDLNETEIDPDAPEPEEGEESPTKTKWLIPGVTAKLRFTTGNLAGYEFDIHSYDNETKEIQIVPFVDESGYKFPSDTSSAFQIGVGDVYHFVDINLPTAYITTAETKLQEEGEEFYNQYKQPQVQYALSIEPYFLEKYTGAPETVTNIFSLGDQIKVRDEDIGVDKSLRIIAYRRDALNPYKYTLTLSDATYNKTIINRIITDIEDIYDVIERNKLTDPFRARRLWMAAQELLDKIFDPEGYYYSEKIKPLSIETMMLQVGAKSQQFILENTRFEPNYLGNPNTINIIGGQLSHFTLNDTVTIWNLTGGLISSLDPTKSYFVYAKCEVDGSNGVIIIDDAQHKVDESAMFYHFIIGHLSSVITNPDGTNGARILSLTYGSTTINGRFIRTGRIESSAGAKTYFDLDEGVIAGNIRFLSNGVETDLANWANNLLNDLENTDQTITDLEDYLNNAFHDGIIDEAEAKAIETYINQIKSDKAGLEATYNKLFLNPILEGDAKDDLLHAKITFFGTVDTLIASINAVIADGRVTPSEKQSINAIFATYRTDKALLATRTEEAKQYVEQVIKNIADDALNQSASAIAAANIARAITDKFGTSITGGLISSVLMLLREATPQDGTISESSIMNTAFISGIQGVLKNLPAFGAGGSYEDAIAGTAKAIIRHDGTSKFSDTEITGKVTATSGEIGKMKIKDDRLTSQAERIDIDGVTGSIILKDSNLGVKTIIHPELLPSISNYFQDYGSYNTDLSSLNTTNLVNFTSKGLNVGGSSVDTFDLTITPFTIRAIVTLSPGASQSAKVEAATRAYLTRNGVEIATLGTAIAIGHKDAPGLTTTNIEAKTIPVTGNATYALVIEHSALKQEDQYATTYGQISGLGTMTTGKIINRSEIGINGMVIATSPQNYTYMVGDHFQVRRGNMFFRITANGIEKSINGTTWTNI